MAPTKTLADRTAALAILASNKEITPEAIGLLHFTGCCLSFSKSIISLRIYTKEAIREKLTKARSTLLTDFSSRNLSEKNSGMKIKLFFI